MALLFFDEITRKMFPTEYNLVLESINITNIKNLERGIIEIEFKHPDFSDREAVIAKIVDHKKVVIQKKLDLRK